MNSKESPSYVIDGVEPSGMFENLARICMETKELAYHAGWNRDLSEYTVQYSKIWHKEFV